MSLKLGDRELPDFPSLVASYPSEELASPTRSTVPLLAFWARPKARFQELSTRLGLDASVPFHFCFEFPVSVQQGSGKPSFTDLMVIGPSYAVALEAKYTEPPYETVRTWLGNPASQNRQSVLAGWLTLIKGATGVALRAEEIADYPYQLVHRTASACHPEVLQHWVVYQLFSEAGLAYYRQHLSTMHHALGGQSTLRFGLLVSPPELSAEFVRLMNRWASGERDLSASVKSGLLSDSLFKFNHVKFTDLGSENGTVGVAS